MILTPHAKTEYLLLRAGLPIHQIGAGTILFWLSQGYSPERIATEIFRVTLPEAIAWTVCRVTKDS